MVEDCSYATIISVNLLCLTNDRVNGYIEESNGNKYLMLAPTGESKDTKKVYK